MRRVFLAALLLLALAGFPVQAHEVYVDLGSSPFFVRVEEPNWMNVNAPISLGAKYKWVSASLGLLDSPRLVSQGLRLTLECRPPLTKSLYTYLRLSGDNYRRCDEGGIEYSMGLEIKPTSYVAVRLGVENGWLYGYFRPQVSVRVGRIL